MAELAPPERNRYVDFLRAFSILAVVIGHWLVAAPYIDENGTVQGGHLLGILPWSQWLTWGFQVMPVFFLVGGYSNGVSWAATRKKGGHYSGWFASRIQRLINPVFPVLLVWGIIAFFGTQMGIERSVVRMATQLALIPVWFLAVYLLVTALAPLTYRLWERFGWLSFAALVAAAVLIDVLTLSFGVPYINFLNFLFVWVGVHQLGYAWRDGRFEGVALLWFIGGLAVLIALVWFGPYPVAMIGVPGAEIANSMPPTIALLALGVMQTGLALSLEKPARKMLDNIRIWTGVVLMNGMIMSIYLWHLTAFVLVMIAAWLAGGIGLDVAPGSAAWWFTRPIWFALYIAVTLPLIMLFVRYERGSSRLGGPAKRDYPVPHWRLVLGMLLICTGLAMTAAVSIASPEGLTGVRLWVVALPFIGAGLVGFGPVYRLVKS
ncbi:acyltransferase [Pontixanthobacter aestiaquae]|uniref:Acyltransferase family protein n=1 Tax=Pontixanthobacter aestiaquae TaxID=1509367 RepID=A0A844Z8U1_9SPHN|nr:acyltransferase [Pontixanthobacter aestiaquae]MDN3645086.1 acyltransferase [Pontixanthobacter aestiaquae]MXO83914.1 acyltransferase family protein [Pontixanthobacter aestiaquae]